MWILVKTIIGLYLLLVGCIFVFQRRLMYHPIKTVAAPVINVLPGIRDVFLRSQDGVKLEAWVHAARPNFPTVVYFHGNAGNLNDRAAKFSGFADAGFGLVAVNYRSFGRSEGNLSEAGVYADARAAIAYACEELHTTHDKLIYFGESLGTGVAVQMASEKAPALLVLEAAYTSVETRSAELYPFVLGVRHLVLDKYDSLSKIAKVHAPLLMLHGEKDDVIPIRHGKTLLAAANNPKEMVVYPDVHHADYTPHQVVVPVIVAAKKYGLIPL